MAGTFDSFDAYSGGRGNLGLIPGYILAFTKAELLGEYGSYLPRVLVLGGHVYVFSILS